MKIAQTCFSSKEDIRAYVAECEAAYRAQIESVCDAAGGHSMIALAGPTCSGKTTTAHILADGFRRRKKALHTVSIDDFYLDHDRLPAVDGKIDYDSPSTIDIPRFAAAVADIEDFGTVTLPRYDLSLGKRVGEVTFPVTENDVFLFEGIQAVYPELTVHLKKHACLPLFISVEDALQVGEVVFAPRELRFLRRLVRDYRFRGAGAEFTFSLWESVVENEDTHIYPNLEADTRRIDSLLRYEVSVIKPFALCVLDTLPRGSAYAEAAEAIR